MQSKSKRAVFIRIAAAVFLVAVTLTFLGETTFNVVREITYHTTIPMIQSMFKGKLSANGALQLLNAVIPFIGFVIDSVLSFITVIMLFALKEKVAGKLFIISAVINILFYIAGLVIYLILISNTPALSSFISANIWPAVSYLFIQTLMILLGLLLLGAFKGATKVFGFILVGLFSVCIIYDLVSFIGGIPSGINALVNAGKNTAFNVISALYNYFLNIPILIMTYTGCIICSLGVALTSKKEKVGEVKDGGQQA